MQQQMNIESINHYDDNDDDDVRVPICIITTTPKSSNQYYEDTKWNFVKILDVDVDQRNETKTRRHVLGNRIFRIVRKSSSSSSPSSPSPDLSLLQAQYPYTQGSVQVKFYETFPELQSLRLEPHSDDFDPDQLPPISYLKFRLLDHPFHHGSQIRLRLRNGSHEKFTISTSSCQYLSGLVTSQTFLLVPNSSSSRNILISKHYLSSSQQQQHRHDRDHHHPPIEALGTPHLRARLIYAIKTCLGFQKSRINLLQIKPNRSILLTGPSGVGKKTLLRIVLDSIGYSVSCIWIRPSTLKIASCGIEGDASAGYV